MLDSSLTRLYFNKFDYSDVKTYPKHEVRCLCAGKQGGLFLAYFQKVSSINDYPGYFSRTKHGVSIDVLYYAELCNVADVLNKREASNNGFKIDIESGKLWNV